MTKNILWLKEINKGQTSEVGGKALRLAELLRAGFKVPRAFCLTTTVYQEFLKDNQLMPQLSKLRLDRNKTILKNICNSLVNKILKGEIKTEVREQVNRDIKVLRTRRLAIRSSATCEDLYLASFAGQFESYLNILADQAFDSIRKCWASIFSNRVLTYTQFHDIELSAVKMAVLIQEMIDAEKGGVLFTKNVLDSTNPHAIIIEASAGMTDDVVSGLVEPERIIINKKTRTEISRQQPNGKILTGKEIKELVQLAVKIETHFQGVPQDIEWAISKEEIYLLQTRPITT